MKQDNRFRTIEDLDAVVNCNALYSMAEDRSCRVMKEGWKPVQVICDERGVPQVYGLRDVEQTLGMKRPGRASAHYYHMIGAVMMIAPHPRHVGRVQIKKFVNAAGLEKIIQDLENDLIEGDYEAERHWFFSEIPAMVREVRKTVCVS